MAPPAVTATAPVAPLAPAALKAKMKENAAKAEAARTKRAAAAEKRNAEGTALAPLVDAVNKILGKSKEYPVSIAVNAVYDRLAPEAQAAIPRDMTALVAALLALYTPLYRVSVYIEKRPFGAHGLVFAGARPVKRALPSPKQEQGPAEKPAKAPRPPKKAKSAAA